MDEIWPKNVQKERDAYYQAGCAIMALRESLDVGLVSINDQESWIYVTHPDLRQASLRTVAGRADAKSVIRAMLAGPAALLRYSFGACPREINLANRWMLEQDAIWRAISLAGKISKDSPSLIRSLWGETSNVIQGDKAWPAIEAVAQMLLITGELTGFEIRDVAHHANAASE
jgi:hypothetical protein